MLVSLETAVTWRYWFLTQVCMFLFLWDQSSPGKDTTIFLCSPLGPSHTNRHEVILKFSSQAAYTNFSRNSSCGFGAETMESSCMELLPATPWMTQYRLSCKFKAVLQGYSQTPVSQVSTGSQLSCVQMFLTCLSSCYSRSSAKGTHFHSTRLLSCWWYWRLLRASCCFVLAKCVPMGVINSEFILRSRWRPYEELTWSSNEASSACRGSESAVRRPPVVREHHSCGRAYPSAHFSSRIRVAYT